MKILHITPSTNGYEEVTLLANRHSKNNQLAIIEKNGETFMTGGFLIRDTPTNRAFLDSIPRNEQYDRVREFKSDPWVKSYYVDTTYKAPVPEFQEEELRTREKSWFSNIISKIFN